MEPVNKFRKTGNSSLHPVYDQQISSYNVPQNNYSRVLPEELIISLFAELGFLHGTKVSLIDKNYRIIFEKKYMNPKISFCVDLFKVFLCKVEEEKNLANYFFYVKNLIKFDRARFLTVGLRKIDELINSDSINKLENLNIITKALVHYADTKDGRILPLLEKLKPKASGKEGKVNLALAYTSLGDIEKANEIIPNFSSQEDAIDEICLQSLIKNPDEAENIIAKATLDSLQAFTSEHMKKLSSVLRPSQMDTVLQLFQKRMGINNALVHGYIFSGNFNLALSCLENGWGRLIFNGLTNRKTNPCLHFVEVCKLTENNDILQKFLELLDQKKSKLTKDSPSAISLTLLRAYHRMNKSESVDEILNLLKKHDKIRCLHYLAKKYAESGHKEQAIDCVKKLEHLIKDPAFNTLFMDKHRVKMAQIYILLYMDFKKLEQMEKILRKLRKSTEFAENKSFFSEWKKSDSIFDKLEEIKKSNDSEFRADRLSELAELSTKISQDLEKEAKEKEILGEIKKSTVFKFHSNLFSELAEVCVGISQDSKRLEEAKEMLEQVKKSTDFRVKHGLFPKLAKVLMRFSLSNALTFCKNNLSTFKILSLLLEIKP